MEVKTGGRPEKAIDSEIRGRLDSGNISRNLD